MLGTRLVLAELWAALALGPHPGRSCRSLEKLALLGAGKGGAPGYQRRRKRIRGRNQKTIMSQERV